MSKKVRGVKQAAEKAAKVKLVRDGYTMPKADHGLLDVLKARALEGRYAAKKSELLRAGLHALHAMTPAALLAALSKLSPVKTGRPKQAGKASQQADAPVRKATPKQASKPDPSVKQPTTRQPPGASKKSLPDTVAARPPRKAGARSRPVGVAKQAADQGTSSRAAGSRSKG